MMSDVVKVSCMSIVVLNSGGMLNRSRVVVMWKEGSGSGKCRKVEVGFCYGGGGA